LQTPEFPQLSTEEQEVNLTEEKPRKKRSKIWSIMKDGLNHVPQKPNDHLSPENVLSPKWTK